MTTTVGLQRVTWFEVLLALVVAAGWVQAADIAGDDLTLTGLFRFGVVLLMLWWAWTAATGVAAGASHRHAPHGPGVGGLAVVQVLALLVAAVTAGTATGVTADAFAWAYFVVLVAQTGIAVLLAPGDAAAGPDRWLFAGFVAALLFPASTVVSGTLQQLVWIVGVLALVAATVVPRTGRERLHPTAAGDDLAERALLGMVALLGAVALKAVSALTGQGFTGTTVGLAVLVGVAVLAVWRLVTGRPGARVRPSPAAGYVWSASHLVLVAGLALLPVGAARAGLLEPSATLPSEALLAFGLAVGASLLGVAGARAVTVVPQEPFRAAPAAVPALVVAVVAAAGMLLAGLGLVGVELPTQVVLGVVGLLLAVPALLDVAWPRVGGSADRDGSVAVGTDARG